MRKLRLLCAPVLACVLLGATIAPASVGASSLPATPIVLDSSLKIHPLLQAEAQIDPTRVVRVIVQQVQPPSSGFLGNLVGAPGTLQVKKQLARWTKILASNSKPRKDIQE